MEFIDHSPEITDLAKALIQVQRTMSPATKDGKNPFTQSNYATLNSVMESCRDALLSNNIWLCQYLVPVEMSDCIGLMTKLTHTESGQWQASLAVVPLPKADPQGMGSAITYARRYAITAMLGMITEDDDGEAAKQPAKASKSIARNAAPPFPDYNYLSETPGPDNKLSGLDAEFEMPQLLGVTYQHITAQDGQNCIIATGNTQSHRTILSKTGFRWNPQKKFWWKYADAI